MEKINAQIKRLQEMTKYFQRGDHSGVVVFFATLVEIRVALANADDITHMERCEAKDAIWYIMGEALEYARQYEQTAHASYPYSYYVQASNDRFHLEQER